MYNVELKKISDELKLKVIEFLEDINHNESYIVHFLSEADKQPEPEKYIRNKFPEIFD